MNFSILFLFIFICISTVAKPQSDTIMMDFDTQWAINQGLQFLVEHQNLSPKENDNFGSFTDNKEDRLYSIAITSFACLSLIANGNPPYRGKYGLNTAYGVDFILRCVNRNGYISCAGDDSRMHGHGFAVLLLAEVYGMTKDKTHSSHIYEKLKKSIELTLKSQTPDGGWGYLPTDTIHEGSVTVIQLQALRAARNVGIKVPKKSIDRAIEYLRKSANPDGSFKYRLGMTGSHSSFPLTAAGVASLNATGEYESEEVKRGLEFMMQYLPPKGSRDRYYNAFYFYGHFYAAQAMYHAPSPHWERWYPAIRTELLRKRDSATGAWTSRFGSVYATSIATLILQIPYNYLPIFQR